MASLISSMLVMLFTVIFGFLIVSVMISFKKSHRVEVRIPTSKGSSMIEGIYWTIPKKDKKSGIVFWKSPFFQKKFQLPEPPTEVCDIMKSGKLFCVVYRLSEDEYVYAKDMGFNKESVLEKEGKKFTEIYKPFTTVQRQVLVHQYEKAVAENPKTFFQEHGIVLICVSVLAMIIVLMLVYWGEIGKSFIEVGDKSESILQKASNLYDGASQELMPDGQRAITTTEEKPPVQK